ncbi:hypothetical protein SLS62_000168 [Diatrype stigma]|uniref:HMG box domain-containing protein n=1 Tax=Diatrype stigma TaxID=117547 RepID=A0AAN9YXU9_9PEZI
MVTSDAMRTRSGKAIRTSQTAGGSRPYRADPYSKPSPPPKARAAKSAKKTKKAAAAEKEEDGEFILDAPLSELCADMASVTEIDIDAYAKRTIEARRAEVVHSKTGKTKRPSNAFMLYRKAYQNRAKELKKHDNHQVVSKVCGSSWRREDPRVKAYFTDLARIESELHHSAFPDYKFAPAKARNRKGGPAAGVGAGAAGAAAGQGRPYNLRRGGSPDGEDSELELADFDYATQPPSRTASRATHYDMHHPDAEYIPPGGGYQYMHHNSPHLQQQQQQHMMSAYQSSPPPPHHMSSYEFSNPGRPKPQPYGTLAGGGGPGGGGQNLAHHQQQQQMYPPYGGNGGNNGMAAMPFGGPGMSGLPGHVENVYIHRTDSPGSVAAYGASAGASPILPPHGGQYGGGGGSMMNAMYGPPLHHHQQHGLAHPQMQQPQQQQQQLHHNNQNIDPSLMAPLHQQDEVRSVASANDPYDGPLGIYNADGGGGEFSLGGYGGGIPDPIYQPTPPPMQHQQHQPPPPQQHHHHQQQHQQQQQQQQHGGGLPTYQSQPHHHQQQSNHALMVADDDLWKIEPTALDDPFDFDLLDGRSPDPEGEEEGGGGEEFKGDGRGDGGEGAAADNATGSEPGGGAADDGSIT